MEWIKLILAIAIFAVIYAVIFGALASVIGVGAIINTTIVVVATWYLSNILMALIFGKRFRRWVVG